MSGKWCSHRFNAEKWQNRFCHSFQVGSFVCGSAGRLAPPSASPYPPDAESAIHGASLEVMIPNSPTQRKRDFGKC